MTSTGLLILAFGFFLMIFASTPAVSRRIRRLLRGEENSTEPLYYGWIVVAVCFFIVLISAGARTSFGAFFNPMREDFGWSYGVTSLALSIGILFWGFFGPFGGYLLDKFGGHALA